MVKVDTRKIDRMRYRMRTLPKLAEQSASAVLKKDAVGLIETFQDGIRKNNFGLAKLSAQTIERKMGKGYTRPRSPLYGAGDSRKNSYINALGLRRMKNGWKVFVRWAKHHESSLSLRDLFYIHENGAVIMQNRGGNAVAIRIPPRPAFFKAYRRWLRKRSRKEDIREVKKAIGQLLRTGTDKGFRKILQEARRKSKSEDLS